ncbi:MAG: FecR family protein [Bacteroidales bacterium]|nr:FecR family protein [Bacteroidales bacterium]
MDTKNKNTYNIDAAWTNLYNRLENNGLLHEQKKSISVYKLGKIAALFIISFAMAYWAFYSYTEKNIKMQIADTRQSNNIKTVLLPDGSIVDLNLNSQLTYPENFTNTERTVELKGEAFFTIAKNPNKPFIIETLGKEIKVLVTSFNIKTDVKTKQVKVFVKTGKVRFYEVNNSKKQLTLEAGFVGIIDKNTAKKQKINDPNYLAWKTKYFDFSYGERMDVIIKKLNAAYHVNIVLENKDLNNKIVYTTYNNHSLDTVLQLIAIVNNLKIEKKENKIVLK